MGHAVSESEAPRRASREREMFGGMGVGIGMGRSEVEAGWESWRSVRMGLEREMADRRAAV